MCLFKTGDLNLFYKLVCVLLIEMLLCFLSDEQVCRSGVRGRKNC
jgi:hypothetical protein